MTLDNNQIQGWIEEACNKVARQDAIENISFQWNTRIKRLFGRANPKTKEITLSAENFSLRDEADNRKTVFHEVAHILVYDQCKWRIMPHGREWKMMMLRMGYPKAKACSIFGNPTLEAKKIIIHCAGCNQSIQIGKLMATRTIQNKRRLRCVQCCTPLPFEAVEVALCAKLKGQPAPHLVPKIIQQTKDYPTALVNYLG